MHAPFACLEITINGFVLHAAVYEYPFMLHIGNHLYQYTQDGSIHHLASAVRPAVGYNAHRVRRWGEAHVEIAFESPDTLEIKGYHGLVDHDDVLEFWREEE
jgi:hypothetical protein